MNKVTAVKYLANLWYQERAQLWLCSSLPGPAAHAPACSLRPAFQPSGHQTAKSEWFSPLLCPHAGQIPQACTGVGARCRGTHLAPGLLHSRHEPLLNPSLDTRNSGQGGGCAEPVIFLVGMLVRWESPDSDTSLLPDLGQISIPSKVSFSQAGNTLTLPDC